tara:strand:+ start:2630 stop:2986 length:357 start_codon:yes stop_codon:yes gene_type:complete
MSTLAVGTIKSISSTPPVFQNTSGVEIGQLAFAWCNINPTGSSTIADSHNISSVSETNQNTYVISFTRACANANYAIGSDVETETNHFTDTHQTGSFRFRTGGNLSDQHFSAIVFGDS